MQQLPVEMDDRVSRCGRDRAGDDRAVTGSGIVLEAQQARSGAPREGGRLGERRLRGRGGQLRREDDAHDDGLRSDVQHVCRLHDARIRHGDEDVRNVR